MVSKELMSFEQIGQELGISTSEAYKIYKGAMKKLRKKINKNSKVRAEFLWYAFGNRTAVQDGATTVRRDFALRTRRVEYGHSEE